MGAAVRNRGEQDRAADGQRGNRVPRQEFGRDVPLVVQHDDEGIEPSPVKQSIGTERPGDRKTSRRRGLDRRLDDLDVLPPETSRLRPRAG